MLASCAPVNLPQAARFPLTELVPPFHVTTDLLKYAWLALWQDAGRPKTAFCTTGLRVCMASNI